MQLWRTSLQRQNRGDNLQLQAHARIKQPRSLCTSMISLVFAIWASGAMAQPLTIAPVANRAPTLVREGAFVVEREGRLTQLDSGEWVFVFEASDGEPDLPTMILEPSLNLMAMRRLSETGGAAARFRVSGEVFVHRGRNHLLPTRYAVMNAATTSARQESASKVAAPTLPPPTLPTADPSVAELINALEHATSKRDASAVARDATETSAAIAKATNSNGKNAGVRLLREGTMVLSRAGRVVRSSTGSVTFVVDVDADSLANAEPPMRLSPSLATMALEAATETLGGVTPVVLSGRVFLYEGRNYLLPTMFRIRSAGAGDLTSAQ